MVAIAIGMTCFVAVSKAFASINVEATGQGSTFEQAKSEALREAVTKAYGEAIASQMQVTNDRITRDEIISYSSGYVDKYEVLEQSKTENQVKVKLLVYVSDSKLAHRLLGRSEGDGKIDGSRLSTQVETLADSERHKQELIGILLDEYPKRAYALTIGKAKSTRLINQRDPIYEGGISIEIPLEVAWSKNYINALNSLFEIIESKCTFDCPQPGNARIRTGIFSVDEYSLANWQDISALTTKLTANTTIQATIKNLQGDAVAYRCWNFNPMASVKYLPSMYGLGPTRPNLVINANTSTFHELQIKVPAITADRTPLAERIRDFENIDIKIVDSLLANCSR